MKEEILTIIDNLKQRRNILASIALTICFVLNCMTAPGLAVTSGQKPKLVVLLIADQFPVDYFFQCIDKPQTNGFKQLIENGANFTSCRYLGATNQTACNLAAIMTGAYPSATGIVGNEWYDRRKQKVLRVAGQDDDLTSSEENSSVPSLLLGTTIGDELKIATNGLSRLVSLSISHNDAVLLAGKSKDQAFWWDCRTGTFAGECRLSKGIPDWAKLFNEKRYSEQFLGKNWQPSGRLNSFVFSGNYQPQKADAEKTFAYLINSNSRSADESYYTRYQSTPWANQMLVDFAKEAIEHESLGQHEVPDMLVMSFSPFELVGKNYGPFSQEAQDMVFRFDQSLSDLFTFLEGRVGLANCLIVFTAAHGACAPPAMLESHGIEGGLVDTKAFCSQLNSLLAAKLGRANWIESFVPPNLYLNLNAVDHSNFRQPDVERLTAKLGRSIAGVAEIYTACQFFMNQIPVGPQVDMVRKSYFWGRSGELYVVPKLGYVFSSDSDGIADGSPYGYDIQVPLLLYGNQVKPGNYSGSASPSDIAPTIANMLSITIPAFCEGRVLTEALGSPVRTKNVKTGK